MTSIDKSFLQQPFENVLGEMLATTIKLMDWHFFLDDKPLPISMMTGNRAMLPAILWNAEKSHQHLTGRSIGVQFRSDGEASVGAQASIGEINGRARSVFPLFCLETLCQAIESFPSDDNNVSITPQDLRDNTLSGRKVPPRGAGASVDHLVQAFFEDHERGMLPWTPDSNPKSPNLAWAQSGQGSPVNLAQTQVPV